MTPDPRDPCRPHRLMARQNALANVALHAACAQLAPGEWEAERVSFFPSIRETLNHLWTVDVFYLDALHGGTTGYAHRDNPVPWPDLADLAREQRRADLSLVAFCDALTPPDLDRVVEVHRPGGFQYEALPELLLHIGLHAVHHRGQAHAMLAGTSVAPPQLDEFICRGEGNVRADQMAVLGWSEDYLAS
ncbi:damage-inducible protein DinB [Oceanicola sp. 22II-s10i]|uniref:DinB family protein n=1 Tax=Oceanicola sp. 22II-s10i TaxID=1317116 RepID=UPI000B52940E|nr:DinB family protein [Oceanicola sp. 22II-s10i]OWU85150.1 damage-inducible protein DinB [Oceanicola sp. 22II-s10i]